ncbi:MAG: hypothetical protein IJY20_05155 [Clostridia bacterium]|nr:hypothetical protein [Clostridia bacterium]
MILFILSFTLYIIALIFFAWHAFVTQEVFWQILFALLTVSGVFVLCKTTWTFFTSILSRMRFVSTLKRLARKKYTSVELNILHHPLLSFFKTYPGSDLILKVNEKNYHIKFFPHFIKKSIVHIVDEKTAIFSKQWALVSRHIKFAPNQVLYGQDIPVRPPSEELMDHQKRILLQFEKDACDKVILISPRCYQMTCVKNNGRDIIDNGYVWNKDITFWYQKAFLNRL